MKVHVEQPEASSKLDQSGLAESSSSLTLGDIAQMLRRHIVFIIFCVILSTGISEIYIRMTVPIYQATTSIRIDPSRVGSLGLADLTGGAVDDSEMVDTEMAIIKSDAVAIDTLHSLSDAEFLQYTHVGKNKLAIPVGATFLSPSQEGLLGHFKSQILVAHVPETQLVTVSFQDPDPRVAAMLVNHLIQAYMRQSFDSRYGSVAQVTTWLSSEMETLNERAIESQKKLADFQEQNNILALAIPSTGSSSGKSGSGDSSSAGTSIGGGLTTTLNSLQERLIQTEADKILREAQMRAAETGDINVIAHLFPNPELQALQAQQASLYGQYTQLSTKFGSKYPPLVDLKSQMQKIDAQVQLQIDTIRAGLKQEYDTATTVGNLLQAQYDAQTDKAYALNRKVAEYAVLASEASSSRDLYNTLQYKLQQAGVDAGLSNIDTMVVDVARAPLMPIAPKKLVILSFGFALGLFGGIGAAFLREATSDKIQGVEQIEAASGYHMLSIVPHIRLDQDTFMANRSKGSANTSRILVAYRHPNSEGAEAFRNLRNALLLSTMNRPAKTFLISSTIPGEGKSSTSANFAVVLAQKGARVLLIDTDLHRPSLHVQLGAQNAEGLSDVLLSEEVIRPFKNPLPDLENLFLLTAGKKIPFPSEALASDKFHTLLTEWEKEFDFVIIDSAPLLVLSDSLPLASWVDSVILVVRYNMTSISALKRVREMLRHSTAHVAGVVINDLAVSQAGYYGGYGHGYYTYN